MFDDDSRYSGNLFVDANLVSPMKSLWNVPGTRLKQFDTVLRVMPGKRNDGSWSKFRTGTGKGEFGRWIYSAWAVRAIGEPAVTFFLCSDEDVQDHNYDPRQHPCYILYNAIYWAVDEGNKHVQSHWAPMVTSKQRKVIKKPGPMFLVQCLIYGRGDKLYDPPMGVDEGEKIVCFDLASDGGKCLRSLLDKRKSPDELPEDGTVASYADYYQYGDITAFDGGKFVQLYPANQDPSRDGHAPAVQGPRRSLSRAAVAESRSRAQREVDSDRDKIGYEVSILDEYQGWEPGIEPDLAAALAEKIYPWPEIIKVPDHKTAASYLWSRMRFGGELKLDVLLYAWQDHPDWLPDKDSDIWAEWINRHQVSTKYDPDGGVDDDDDRPAAQHDADRRPRQRAGDSAERADDQPRSTRRLGAPAPVQAPAEAADDDPPPHRASRMVAQQEAATPQETQPLKGRVARGRAKPTKAAGDVAAGVAGGSAAPDVAAAATTFRPSRAAAAAANGGDDDDDRPVVNRAGGFAEPPPAAAPKQATKPAAAKPVPEPTANNQRNPKDVMAAARAKFMGAQ
jgi:hypothetical protein